MRGGLVPTWAALAGIVCCSAAPCPIPAALIDVAANVSGMGPTAVFALQTLGSELFVGGQFATLSDGRTAHNIAAYTAAKKWAVLPAGPSNGVGTTPLDFVLALAVLPLTARGAVTTVAAPLSAPLSSYLVVGGNFSHLANGVASNHVALWDGAAWSTLCAAACGTPSASVGVDGPVHALAVSGETLFLGGAFRFLGDEATSANHIVSWSAAGGFSPLLPSGGAPTRQNGVNGIVQALVFSRNTLYCGGNFDSIRDAAWTPALHVAQWNVGSGAWAPIGGGIPGGYVFALAVDETAGGGLLLIAGGDFATQSGNLAAFNGSTWAPLPVGTSGSFGVDGVVRGLLFEAAAGGGGKPPALVVAGNFTKLGDGVTTANHLVKWERSSGERASWAPLPTCAGGNGVGDLAVALMGGNEGALFVGGWFIAEDGAERVARF